MGEVILSTDTLQQVVGTTAVVPKNMEQHSIIIMGERIDRLLGALLLYHVLYSRSSRSSAACVTVAMMSDDRRRRQQRVIDLTMDGEGGEI